MIINIVHQPITQIDCQAAVFYIYSDIRPPKGPSGTVDWYMNGFISKLIKQGKITGRLNEIALLATQGRIMAQKALLLGLGHSKDVQLDMIYNVWKQGMSALCATDIYLFATSIPFISDWGWGAGDTVKRMMQGITRGIESAGRNIREFKLSLTNFSDLMTKENKDQACNSLKSMKKISLLGY
jgi:hypothetical protein